MNSDYYHDSSSQWLTPETSDDDGDYLQLTEEELELLYQDDYDYPGGGAAGSSSSFADILEQCIEPTVRDAFLHIGKLLFWCLIFRIATQSSKKKLFYFILFPLCSTTSWGVY